MNQDESVMTLRLAFWKVSLTHFAELRTPTPPALEPTRTISEAVFRLYSLSRVCSTERKMVCPRNVNWRSSLVGLYLKQSWSQQS
ncbi:hypothetical protein GBAR_LOCUS6331, partial [Geodia barretti]